MCALPCVCTLALRMRAGLLKITLSRVGCDVHMIPQPAAMSITVTHCYICCGRTTLVHGPSLLQCTIGVGTHLQTMWSAWLSPVLLTIIYNNIVQCNTYAYPCLSNGCQGHLGANSWGWRMGFKAFSYLAAISNLSSIGDNSDAFN